MAEAETRKAGGLAEAEVRRAQGLADAEAIRAQGLATAEATRAQALAEAEGMLQRVHAWQEYNQAAIAQLLIERLPDVVRAAAEPMSRIDRVTLVNTGGTASGNGVGISAINQELAKVLATMPEVVHALTGIDLKQILSNLGEQAVTASEPHPDTDGHVEQEVVKALDSHTPASIDDEAQG